MSSHLDKSAPIHGKMTRAALDPYLAGIALAPMTDDERIANVLGQDPAELNPRALAWSEIAETLLPTGALSAVQKAAYGQRNYSTLPTLGANVAEALHLLGAAGLAAEVPAEPERIEQLLKQRQAFAAFAFLGRQITNSAMDQRALVGAFSAFLMDRALTAIEHRYQALPEAERAALLDDFAPALLALDEVLRHPTERKAELTEKRATLAEKAADAQAEAQLAETLLMLRQNIAVPRAELFAAARRHLSRTQPEALAGATTPLPPPSGTRRLV